MLEAQAQTRASLVPIRVEFETDTLRIRDCFVWNLNETLIKPESFAKVFCADLDLPSVPWAETVANQIRAQIEDHEGVASMDIGVDNAIDSSLDPHVAAEAGEEVPECRVILSVRLFSLVMTMNIVASLTFTDRRADSDVSFTRPYRMGFAFAFNT
jgi:chromatin structure-remodeling complex subunit SFH1